MFFSTALTSIALAASLAAAQLPKNGGLNDERPIYENPEDAVYIPIEPKLKTPWTDDVASNPDNVWPEYPRPQLRRDTWLSLNGVWQFQAASSSEDVESPPFNTTLNERVLVPFCIESGLSGIAQQHTFSWYRTTFEIPDTFQQNVVLHFGAVDYQATVFVNGQNVGSHVGGYDKFAFDITSHIVRDSLNELVLFVYDPTDGHGENIPIGKQRIVPSHIFYTPCTGIWQTVSLEAVPSSEYITHIDLRAAANGSVTTTISTSDGDSSSAVQISVLDPSDNSQVLFTTNGTANTPFSFTVEPTPETWRPDQPNLYNISVTVADDMAYTYTGFRTVERVEIDGVQRVSLNGQPIFQFGPLDQGYWPDGLHSPPSYDAMVFDIQFVKDLGMNFVRKHIKVEPDLYYYAADSLGIILMQDMPALNIAGVNEQQQAEFERQLDIMVQQHVSFPSILTFVIYNEGWGQLGSHPELYLTPRLREFLAGHQIINSVSGWNDVVDNPSDYHDNHKYSSPQCGSPFSSLPSSPFDSRRIGFQGEFGGVGHNASVENLWIDAEAIAAIPETYEIDDSVEIWNYRALRVIEELREQTEMFSCNGGVYTQTTDVEGEVNGFLTYDRAVERTDRERWRAAVQSLYDTFEARVYGS